MLAAKGAMSSLAWGAAPGNSDKKPETGAPQAISRCQARHDESVLLRTAKGFPRRPRGQDGWATGRLKFQHGWPKNASARP
jgi:hypothetical protein